jgi:RNA polymerase sigma factor (sigma-70 family)
MDPMQTLGRENTTNTTPMRPWFADHPTVRTRGAADRARRLVNQLTHQGSPGTRISEQNLFIALHACAYMAVRTGSAKCPPARLGKTWIRRWKRVREFVVQENLGLVYAMLSRFRVHEPDRNELISEGMLALTRAVDRYNPFRGFRFSTYACNVIARAMMRRGKILSRYRRTFITQPEATFEGSKSSDRNADLYAERLRRAMDHNLGQLTELESHVLAKRFPLSPEGPDTFREIGEAIGLSKERVRQIQNSALTKLRRVLTKDPVLQ